MSNFKDLFSVQAKDYAQYRPKYPSTLFQYLANLPIEKNTVWDAGTGNGQAAAELSSFFHQVKATDPSEKQISEAVKKPNIIYLVEKAESPSFPEKVNLITVAQAFHWFKHDEFANACLKVAAPNAHLAVWTYAISTVTPEIDKEVDALYSGLLGPYWEKERKYVETGYRSIHMPFAEINVPEFKLHAEWSLDQYLGYFKTWSALQTYLKSGSMTEVEKCFQKISEAWGKAERRMVRWPLGLRVWKI